MTHVAMIIVAVKMATVASRWHRRATETLVFGLSLLNVDSSAINLSHRIVLDQVLCDSLIIESDKAKASRLARVDIFQNDGIIDLTKLHKVLF